MAAVAALLLLAGCGTAPPVVAPTGPPQPVTATAADGRGAIRPAPAPSGCTKTVTDPFGMPAALANAVPGDKICLVGDLSDRRLELRTSGTPKQPIQVVGDGRTLVKGITLEGSYLSVSNINAVNPEAPGISLMGSHLTVENSTSIEPRANDGDGLRFWGSDITIRHNTIRNTRNIKAHADCMQTFATDTEHKSSQRIIIDGNRCEDIDNTCLIVEGPNSEAGDGSGVGATTDIRWTNNYCENRADQALQIDDVQRMTVTGNTIAGKVDHAFAFQNKCAGIKVSGNKLNPSIHFEVGMDDSSEEGYQGPEVGGDP
ncbi:hypothetical protein GCM10023321_19210 [Pseudonocardia eucalypti]|uniref:Right handed beta helix domain-containing protein n=1 Tax=Pseudonocardia eucalypti TaxID=648755 RepID=A0ABP9PTD8_9PSEU|nr:hypothetical protein [Pseudonocardia eucalypti]